MNRFAKRPLTSIKAAWLIFICGILISIIWCVLCVTVIDKCGCWDDSTSLWELSPVPLVISFASVFFLKLTRTKTIGLIGLLIILMAELWFFGVATCGACIHPSGGEAGYNYNKDNLQAAVKAYQDKNMRELPTINGTVAINGSDYRIVNACALLASQGGKLTHVPDGSASINGSDNDNCDAGCGECSKYASYIWAVDANGSVYSICVGAGCQTNNSGYQGVWP
jgi:hypothetical protein